MEKHVIAGRATTEVLAVPGARLHLETRGDGPTLVCIVGGNGDAEVFSWLATALARQYTVAVYDRRGFSRSPLDGAVDDAARLAADVDDAVRVIEHTGRGPAYVLGSSSGAIVGLGLLTRHPGSVRTVVAHEPPLMTLVPDGATWLALFDRVHARYGASGVAVAMAEFNAGVGLDGLRDPPPGIQLPPPIAAMLARAPANQAFWLEHELRQYTRIAPDQDALRAVADQLVLAVGLEPPDAVLARPARALAASLGARLVELPGGHAGYATHPAEFAARLVDVLGRAAP